LFNGRDGEAATAAVITQGEQLLVNGTMFATSAVECAFGLPDAGDRAEQTTCNVAQEMLEDS
jgi:hypothetical protein